jgi:hypothetical protein
LSRSRWLRGTRHLHHTAPTTITMRELLNHQIYNPMAWSNAPNRWSASIPHYPGENACIFRVSHSTDPLQAPAPLRCASLHPTHSHHQYIYAPAAYHKSFSLSTATRAAIFRSLSGALEFQYRFGLICRFADNTRIPRGPRKRCHNPAHLRVEIFTSVASPTCNRYVGVPKHNS